VQTAAGVIECRPLADAPEHQAADTHWHVLIWVAASASGPLCRGVLSTCSCGSGGFAFLHAYVTYMRGDSGSRRFHTAWQATQATTAAQQHPKFLPRKHIS